MPAEYDANGALPPAIIVPLERARELQVTSHLEWLEPDGRGGYAAGTVSGCNTRRYHGLLVVARRPPTDRIVLLSRLEERVVTPDGHHYDLATNHYPGVIHPHGYRYLEEFRLDPWPIWRYRLNTIVLVRELFMARDQASVVVSYRVEGGAATLEVRPLVAGRDFHALVTENDVVARTAAAEPGLVVYQPYQGIPPLFISHDGGEWRHEGAWYRQACYQRERDRGLDDREDLYSPGVLEARIGEGETWTLASATAPVMVSDAGEWRETELRRRERVAAAGRRLVVEAPNYTDLAARLALAGDAFLVQRGRGSSIIAGYPWFADWGRDSMISIPGLTLALGRPDLAASILRNFAKNIRDGLIPNRFPDTGGRVPPDHYNAVDASLWFIEAVAALGDAELSSSGEEEDGQADLVSEGIAEFWPAVHEIIEAYRGGTRFGIRMDDADGLITHGEPGVQLTWMDARVDGWVVTPRDGKAVEINALWYNALERAAMMAEHLGEEPGPYHELASRVKESFRIFSYREGGYLYDRIRTDGEPDPRLRPNQIFAISLPHSPVGKGQAASMLRVIERELLVPLGLRTLAPDDPDYRGRFEGGRHERDAAYHSGTAWPWLLGPYITAYLRVHGGGEGARRHIDQIIEPFRPHLLEGGLGQITEVISGDPPHRSGGTFAQAWSCAELLRVLPEVAGIRG